MQRITRQQRRTLRTYGKTDGKSIQRKLRESRLISWPGSNVIGPALAYGPMRFMLYTFKAGMGTDPERSAFIHQIYEQNGFKVRV